MKTIKVYGELKKKLGQSTFELNVDTPAQAIKALCANFPDLSNWFIENDQNGYGYKVQVGKQKIFADNLKPMLQPWTEKDVLKIVPVIAGAGCGFRKLLLGSALIGGAFLFTHLSMGSFFSPIVAPGSLAAAMPLTKAAV